MSKKKIVISGINLYKGGPLTIYYCLLDEFLEKGIYEEYDITIFVYKKILFKKYEQYFNIIELPKSRSSWVNRLYYEYYYFKKYSTDKNIFLWISLHDITPNVKSKHLVTYCHNPSFSYKGTVSDFRLDKKFYLFSKFYKYLYRINIHKNDFVIIQQQWIANSFVKMYNISSDHYLIFPPNIQVKKITEENNKFEKTTFFFPSVARSFKNFEIVCEATKKLCEKGISNFQVILTIDGVENNYSKEIVEKYKNIKNIKFIGLQTLDKVHEYYQKCHCVIFPSKLETWGLPITEAKKYDLPLLVGDLEYAHETVGKYEKVSFFDVSDANKLTNLMFSFINNTIYYDGNEQIKLKNPVHNWNTILNCINSKETERNKYE